MYAQPDAHFLSRYHLQGLIGKGAYASVYRAVDEHSGEQVALKILDLQEKRAFATPAWMAETRARFIQEAELGKRLAHPRLIKVYEFVEQPERLLTVMELMAGGSLTERLPLNRADQRAFEIAEALEIARQIAEGLAYLHQKDIVHRDLHPGNILFAEDGSLKIADLGLAQVPGGVTIYTQFGSAGGTTHPGNPDYCSPEHNQINRRLTSAADIYGLGAILFELLTRRIYINLRPGTTARSLRADISPWLDDLLRRFLARDPEHRPWDGAEAAKALEEAIEWERQRQAELQRLAEISQLITECEAAWADENWSSAEAALARLRELDAHDAVPRLEEAIAQGRHAAEQRRARLAGMVECARTALQDEEWRQVEQIQLELKELGSDGLAAAQVLQAELITARKLAKKQQVEVEELAKKASQAMREEDWQQVEAIIAELKSLGRQGSLQAQKLEKECQQARQAEEERQKAKALAQEQAQEVIRLTEQVEADLAREDLKAARAGLDRLAQLGEKGKEKQVQLQPRVEEVAQRLRERQEKLEAKRNQIARLKGEAETALKEGNWNLVEARIATLQTLGEGGVRCADQLRQRLARSKQSQQYKKALYWGIGMIVLLAGIIWIGRRPDQDSLRATQTAQVQTVTITAEQIIPPTKKIEEWGVEFYGTSSADDQATQVAQAQPIQPGGIGNSAPLPYDTPKPAPTRTPTPTRLPLNAIMDEKGIPMVLVPAGYFQIGNDDVDAALEECQKLNIGGTCPRSWFEDETPAHMVYLDAYYIDIFEVTNSRYAECVEIGNCTEPGGKGSATRSEYYGNPEYADYPAIYVDWFQAKAYCEWRGARLPTEAEWEKAARGSDGRIYPWGSNFEGSKVNFCDKNCSLEWANNEYDDGYGGTAPVGSYPAGASPYGAMDMAGNVWEWVSSLYRSYPYDADDGRENMNIYSKHVLRGGAWSSAGYDLFTIDRYSYNPGYQHFDWGFRCARSP